MGFLGPIVNLVLGFHHTAAEMKLRSVESEKWFRAVMQLAGTALVTFWGMWGVAGLSFMGLGKVLEVLGVQALDLPVLSPLAALVGGFFVAALSMAAAVVYLWKRSDLLRTIPLVSPVEVDERVLAMGVSYTEGDAPEKKP